MPQKYTLDYIKQNKIAINCKTVEELQKVREIANPNDWKNLTSKSIFLKKDKSPTIVWDEGSFEYIDINFISKEGYTIIPASQFLAEFEQENKPTNLIPFDLELWRNREQNGCKAICRDGSEPKQITYFEVEKNARPIFYVNEKRGILSIHTNGLFYADKSESSFDLLLQMPEPKVEKWYNNLYKNSTGVKDFLSLEKAISENRGISISVIEVATTTNFDGSKTQDVKIVHRF